MALTEAEIIRYSRQIILPQIGGAGQEKLKNARVLVVGAGGLGSPLALYLAAAGVGTLGLIDDDDVELSNLGRQIIHFTGDVGKPKVDSAEQKLRALNPQIKIDGVKQRLLADNALHIIGGYDVVADACDTFASKFLVNDACAALLKPHVYGAVVGFEGQLMTVVPQKGPCYRCFFREPPPPGVAPTCQGAGILGPVAGIIASLQALEIIKLLTGVGTPLAGRLLLFDGKSISFREISIKKDARCPSCGEPEYRQPLKDEPGAKIEGGGSGFSRSCPDKSGFLSE